MLLAGEPDKAVSLAEAATASPDVSPRVRYVIGRGLLAAGKKDAGLAALKRYLEDDPSDPRATQPGRDRGTRAGARARAQAARRRAALLRDAGARPPVERDVRLQRRLAADLAGRRRSSPTPGRV